MQAKPPTQNLQELQQKVEFAEHVKRITNQIHAASNLDHILLDLHKDILGLFDAEDLTLFAFDADRKKSSIRSPTSIRSRRSASRSPSRAWPVSAPSTCAP